MVYGISRPEPHFSQINLSEKNSILSVITRFRKGEDEDPVINFDTELLE